MSKGQGFHLGGVVGRLISTLKRARTRDNVRRPSPTGVRFPSYLPRHLSKMYALAHCMDERGEIEKQAFVRARERAKKYPGPSLTVRRLTRGKQGDVVHDYYGLREYRIMTGRTLRRLRRH